MRSSKALFLVLDGLLTPAKTHTARQRLAGLLSDFRALGYRVVGIVLDADPALYVPVSGALDVALDDLIVAGPAWEFVPSAWSIARQHSLNVHTSMLVSLDVTHRDWARNAGMRRFEDPGVLFGI